MRLPRPLAAILLLTAAAGALVAQSPALLPYPRQITTEPGALTLSGTVSIGVNSADNDDRFAAGLLAGELGDIDHLATTISRSETGTLVLTRSNTPLGQRLLREAGLSLPAAAEAEGYALVVTPKQAAVVGASAAGLFYGVETLRQLIHPAPDTGGIHAARVEAVHVVDWPALRWRAVQVDLSRGPIPNLAAIERDLALLAELKINAYVLYFENTFAYTSLPLMSAPGGAIDAAEAQQIVDCARQYHITVIPEQESFGHLHLAMQEERYQDLVEVPYGNVLSPTVPASLDFIGKMFAELAPAFPGPFFHIGADETAELGKGRSADLQTAEGPGKLYLDYLQQIDQRLQPYHRQVLFWGDIAQGHPELLPQLPKDMIAVPWSYGVAASYAKLIKPFADAGLTTWVAPGVSNWSRIFPDYNTALPNIQRFVADGRALGSTGLLNTTWMDDGESMFDFTWYGLAFGGAAGWEDQPDVARFQQAYDWALFRADGHDFAQQIETLTRIHQTLQTAIHSDGGDGLMWTDPFTEAGQASYTRMEPAAHTVRLLAEEVIASLAAHRADARRHRELLDPVAFAARRFDFVGEKAIYAHTIAGLYAAAQAAAEATPPQRGPVNDMFSRVNSMNGLLQDMRDGVSSLRGQYKTLWLEENTPYFLDNILVRYDAELLYWQQQARRFDAFAAYYRATRKLPPLVEAPVIMESGGGGPTR